MSNTDDDANNAAPEEPAKEDDPTLWSCGDADDDDDLDPQFMREINERLEANMREADEADPIQFDPMFRVTYNAINEFVGKPTPLKESWLLKEIYEQLDTIDPTDIDAAAGLLFHHYKGITTEDKISARLTRAIANRQQADALRKMNDRFFIVKNEGGKCLVGEWNDSEIGNIILWQSPREFRDAFASEKVFLGRNATNPNLKFETIGNFWLNHTQRREYERTVFDPTSRGIVSLGDDRHALNLWRGWNVKATHDDDRIALMQGPDNSIEALTGDRWPKLFAHLRDVLAAGQPLSFEFILKWSAWTFQNPEKTAGVAICFRGKQGTGKGTYGRMMKKVFGKAARQITKESDVNGKFNNIHRGVCLAFFDEAIYPKARAAQSALKGMLTEPTLMYEAKGRDQIEDFNRIKVIMASNHDWIVPVEIGDRRFAVFDVSDCRKEDWTYFDELNVALDGGELVAFLVECLKLDLKGWQPERSIPQTAARKDQQIKTLNDKERAIYEILATGDVEHEIFEEGKAKLAWMPSEYLDQLLRHMKIDLRANDLAKLLGDLGFRSRRKIRAKTGKRARGYILPPIAAARAAWDAMGLPSDFDEVPQDISEADGSPQEDGQDCDGNWSVPPEDKF